MKTQTQEFIYSEGQTVSYNNGNWYGIVGKIIDKRHRGNESNEYLIVEADGCREWRSESQIVGEHVNLENTYELDQEITLKSGWKGRVIAILHHGNKDIRPPYHQKGIPILGGIGGSLGRIKIIPNDWEVLYRDESNESNIVK